MEFDKTTSFYDVDGIPVSIGAGNGVPACAAWDEKEPREFPINACFGSNSHPINHAGFLALIASCQA